MASFGMQNNALEGYRTESTQVSSGSSSWNVDMTNPGDSRSASRKNNAMPSEFGPLELYDSSKAKSSASQIARSMQLEMNMMMQMMERFIQYMEAMLRAELGQLGISGDASTGGGGGDAPTIGNGGTADQPHCHNGAGDSKSENDNGTRSGSDGGTKSGSDGGTRSGSDGGTKSGSDGGTKSGNDSGTKSGNDSGTKSASDSGIKSGDSGGLRTGDDGGTKTGSDNGKAPVDGGDAGSTIGDDGVPKYADTGVKRGRTIYRDDFDGAKGAHPNSDVFDTQHIGPDGQTRQRGADIDEDAIISDNNTVMDGNGHLQLFADKQKTLDPKTGEYVDYTKGSFNTGKDAADNEKGLTFSLKDYPNGLVIETRAMHPKDPGTKFDALWIMTNDWAADPAKGEKKKDTIEYDAAEGGGAGITVHYPVKEADGKSVSIFGGGKRENLEDGKFHTYTVAISHNGDVVEYIDGKQAFAQKDVFPTDKDLHLRASLEVSPKWTGKKYTGNGGLNSDGAGVIDYLDVSELKP